MKFIHIADVHLGAVPDSDKPWGAEREKEIWESFRKVIADCNEQKADLLLIAGDLFHSRQNNEVEQFGHWRSQHTSVHIDLVTGNQDILPGEK